MHETANQKPNRLINESSPYLIQHAHNPVDWYPWGPEALEKARQENKPIFLSIGYAACHWCHVMAHESFEDPQTAELLNQYFVNIKVDREERPDIDSIYMNAVVALTGQGGWPTSLFLTPEGQPFYGGTYFPPDRRYGMPSFREIVEAVHRAWQNESSQIVQTSREITEHLKANNAWNVSGQEPFQPTLSKQAAQALLNSYDWKQGGWGKAPRFPQPMAIEYLMMQATRPENTLREEMLSAATHALRQMSRGGMYDVVGGGFARYSVDDDWLVPHFEKMLYDNGQLALAYLHAALLTGKPAFLRTCTETLDFLVREMLDPQGGFYSSLDADSEGEEGKYYVWTPDEIEAVLTDPQERRLFDAVYAVSSQGNFEGKNILQRRDDLETLAGPLNLNEDALAAQLTVIHRRLYEARERRVRPGTDDKVLVSWNALALRAFAEAARYLKRPDYLDVARRNAAFLLEQMRPDGQLRRAWRQGQANHSAFLEDYAGLGLALLALYQTDPNPRWYQAALEMAEEMLAGFRDPQGGFYDTHHQHSQLITRPRDIQDNATPSGNAQAAGLLLRLAAYEERGEWRTEAERMLSSLQDLLVRHPTAFGFWLQDLDFAAGPVWQVAIAGPHDDPQTNALLDAAWQVYRPRLVTAVYHPPADEPAARPPAEPGAPGLLNERGMLQGQPTAYACQGFVCKLPVHTPQALLEQLEQTAA